MIVYATKVSVKKAIAGVLVIGAVVLGVTALMPKAAETVDAQAAAGEVDLDQVNLPDPMLDRMEALVKRLTVLESCLARHARRLGCEGCEAAPEDAPCHGQCTDKSEPADTAQ